jgi:endogenous inhibitor of DNA gyrase (YacG/DUF329 family)
MVPSQRFPPIKFQGRVYYRSGEKSYYISQEGSVKTKLTKRYLHRDIWESKRGPIPDGYEVHHKDGNRSNNRLKNLQPVTPTEHKRIHSNTEEHRAHLRRIQPLGNAASHAWRRSPEGRLASAIRSANQPRVTKCCPHCLQLYEGVKKQRFCSQACGVMWRAKQKTKIARAVLKTCPHCGRLFNGRRSDSKYCSPKCQHDALNEREKGKRQIARSVLKKCPGCGKSINDRSAQARYCSPKCQQRVRYHNVKQFR